MAIERTFSIIKPDATRRNLTGKINARFEENGLRIVAQKRIWMTRGQAEQFLHPVHHQRLHLGAGRAGDHGWDFRSDRAVWRPYDLHGCHHRRHLPGR